MKENQLWVSLRASADSICALNLELYWLKTTEPPGGIIVLVWGTLVDKMPNQQCSA